MKGRQAEGGFTLVELLVAMVIAAVVMAAVYTTYASQQKSYLVQEQQAAMQQNLRNSLHYLEQEVRMAGYDPAGGANAGLTTMNQDEIRFTMDLNGDNDTVDSDEDVRFNLSAGVLQRNGQPIAEQIDALNFAYLNEDGAVALNAAEVRAIQVMVVAKTERPDRGFIDNGSYTNQQGDEVLGAQNDNFRRSALCIEVKCRNLGL